MIHDGEKETRTTATCRFQMLVMLCLNDKPRVQTESNSDIASSKGLLIVLIAGHDPTKESVADSTEVEMTMSLLDPVTCRSGGKPRYKRYVAEGLIEAGEGKWRTDFLIFEPIYTHGGN